MPPRDTYMETHLGGGAIMKRKPPASHHIGIDLDARALAWFACDDRPLQQTCALVSKRPSRCLSQTECKNLRRRYGNLLTCGEKQLPPIPPRQNGKRGRVAKSDAHSLWERLKRHEEALLLFAKLPPCPSPTTGPKAA